MAKQQTIKQVVTIGGGTGTFVVLSGLKKIPDIELTAIVSAADSGGATGRLRDAYGFLPLGDARQALIALSSDEESKLMRQLFAYRFQKGDISGHNFGNLFLTALTDILGNDAKAIAAASKILRVKGQVVPVSETPAVLVAELANGKKIIGEHEIDKREEGRSAIVRLTTEKPVNVSDKSLEAIANADVIILGPGDLYTSTLANFTVVGLSQAVAKSKAKLIYIVNLFTRSGQTENYSAKNHVEEIIKYVNREPDVIVINSGELPGQALRLYAAEQEFPIVDDLPKNSSIVRVSLAEVSVAKKVVGDVLNRSLVRHNPEKLAQVLMPYF